jgi:DNA-directed RNA polymerase subunit RPC12/RpoP
MIKDIPNFNLETVTSMYGIPAKRSLNKVSMKKGQLVISANQKIPCICDNCGKEIFKKWSNILKDHNEQRKNLCKPCRSKITVKEFWDKLTEEEYVIQNKKISDSLVGKPLSAEHKEKLRQLNVGSKNGMYGKSQSEETRKKISSKNKGRIDTPEQRLRKSSSRNSYINKHPEYRQKCSNMFLGKKLSVEQIEKRKNKRHFQETKDHIRLNLINFWYDNIRAKENVKKIHSKKIVSKETRKKISSKRIGLKLRVYTKNKISNSICNLIIQGKFNFKSKYKHGCYFSKKNNREHYYRSSYELKAFDILDNDRSVIGYDYEKVKISYEKTNNTVVDLKVYYDNGDIKIIEVKPLSLINEKTNILKFEAIKNFANKNNYLFEIWTERELGI